MFMLLYLLVLVFLFLTVVGSWELTKIIWKEANKSGNDAFIVLAFFPIPITILGIIPALSGIVTFLWNMYHGGS